MFGFGDAMYLTGNLYYNGGWKAIATGAGASMILDASGPKFYTNASASAGGAVTPTERLRIPAAGGIDITNGSVATSGDNYVYSYSGGSSGDVRSGFKLEGSTNTIEFYNGGSEQMRISSGDVSIGTTSSGHKLYVHESANATQGTAQFRIGGAGYSAFHFLDGTAYHIGQNSQSRYLRMYSGSNSSVGVSLSPQGTSWQTYSDERLKKNIEPIESAIESLLGLRTVKYHLKDVDSAESKKRLGLIAQDLVGVLDEVIELTTQEEDDTEYLSVRYTEIIPVVVKAIQEQQATIESQAAAITDLTTRLTALENN